MKLKALIVDDEKNSRENLRLMLEKYCPEVVLLDTATGVEDAATKIDKLKPNLLFLDVDMPPYTGFDLLKMIDTQNVEVIFVTAYNYYAIDAIKFSALYYILKPIHIDELKIAVAKAKSTIGTMQATPLESIQGFVNQSTTFDRLVINTHNGRDFIDFENILYIEADNSYSIFHLKNMKNKTSSRSLKEYDEMLTNKGFFRCHKSYLVNLKHIQKLASGEGDQILLPNGILLPLASRRKEQFLKLI
jgi:two-component system LytT family response regulator